MESALTCLEYCAIMSQLPESDQKIQLSHNTLYRSTENALWHYNICFCVIYLWCRNSPQKNSAKSCTSYIWWDECSVSLGSLIRNLPWQWRGDNYLSLWKPTHILIAKYTEGEARVWGWLCKTVWVCFPHMTFYLYKSWSYNLARIWVNSGHLYVMHSHCDNKRITL